MSMSRSTKLNKLLSGADAEVLLEYQARESQVAGTFIGAGVGGVGGHAVGHELQQQQSMNEQNRRAIYSQQRQLERQRRWVNHGDIHRQNQFIDQLLELAA